MIIDYVDKINLYPELQEYADMVHGFIQRVEKEKLLAGRYDLEKGVFASLQNYNTRPFAGAQMESHKKYCDLQYIVRGNEKIYWASLRKLTVVDDHTEDGDYLLYESGVDQGYTLMERGMFGFYAPEDGHMPSIAVTDPEPVTKIVFKIPVKM